MDLSIIQKQFGEEINGLKEIYILQTGNDDSNHYKHRSRNTALTKDDMNILVSTMDTHTPITKLS